ncbi:MAG: hypothetical protein ACE5DY_06865 [Mariprofundaceae bacterium]
MPEKAYSGKLVCDSDAHMLTDSNKSCTKKVAGSGESAHVGMEDGGLHTHREWLALGERVFAHPRYALLIVAALILCTLEQYPVVLAIMGMFFSVELLVRLWLQYSRGFSDRIEVGFLMIDAVATASLFLVLMLPASGFSGGMYLRLARLLRGMYMLRMLRVFRFLTYETFIYSMPFAVLILALTAVAVLVPESGVFIGIVLMLESVCRAVAVFHTIERGRRYYSELGFAGFDFLLCVALLNVIPGLAPVLVFMRVLRFGVMLNPLGNLLQALGVVISRDDVRKESAMLASMFVLLMALTAMAVLYLYPSMDLSEDESLNDADYAPWQVVLYSFRVLLDPGTAPADAFTPWLALVSMLIVLAGLFFFALFVGLGSNVMHYLLQQLANSPLSARESVLIAGWNHQSIPVLKMFDRMCVRLRRSFASVWIFWGDVQPGARGIGRWLAVRQVEAGTRCVLRDFRLMGVRNVFLFHPENDAESGGVFVDLHALIRETRLINDNSGVVIADRGLSTSVNDVYQSSLEMDVLDSASLKARMLYQMHHCAYMPELGARMLDVVNGETGLYAAAWSAKICAEVSGARICLSEERALLESWLVRCFESGLNLLAAREKDGHFILFSDVCRIDREIEITHVVGLGEEPSQWFTVMHRAMMERDEAVARECPLKAYTWPETWDLRMIFVGWHEGLPAMVEEMALKHHKLSVYVLTPCAEEVLQRRIGRMQKVIDRASAERACAVDVDVQLWDGFDISVLQPMLKGCKVIMLYPEEGDGSEDSCLELWFHEIARMLNDRKLKVKWWTPPKLMVLPRSAENIDMLRNAARLYSNIAVDIGSPDAFHDVFMARQLLGRALLHSQPEQLSLEGVAFSFMQTVLSDAVIIEDVDVERLLADEGADWRGVYQESLRRGWILTAYTLPSRSNASGYLFEFLNRCFPADHLHGNSRMHLLAGEFTQSSDSPNQAAMLLFCRRGILAEDVDTAAETTGSLNVATALKGDCDKGETKVEDVSADKEDVEHVEVDKPVLVDNGLGQSIVKEDHVLECDMPDSQLVDKRDDTVYDLEEAVKEGVVMEGRGWPGVADYRLLRILQKQVSGALELLNTSTEDSLVKLSQAMDHDSSGELTDDIMGALTDLQNIDRVMQRLRNVESCLADWASASTDQKSDEMLWKGEVEKRYVMEEEREVLRSEL